MAIRHAIGVALRQVFVDGKIIGIPVDFATKADDPKIGWVKDSQTTDNGKENDKAMRNRGYMKGPASVINFGYQTTLRDNKGCLRKILDTRSFHNTRPIISAPRTYSRKAVNSISTT